MNPAVPDQQRTRFRRPLRVTVMAYKAILGLSEIIVGVLLAVPSFDPQAWKARNGAATSWPRRWRCCCPSTCARP